MRLAAPADERQVAASAEEPPRCVDDAPGASDGGHLEIVAQDEPGEAEAPAQQTADDLRRERCRELRIERAASHVGDQHGGAAGVEDGTERDEVDALQVV